MFTKTLVTVTDLLWPDGYILFVHQGALPHILADVRLKGVFLGKIDTYISGCLIKNHQQFSSFYCFLSNFVIFPAL